MFIVKSGQLRIILNFKSTPLNVAVIFHTTAEQATWSVITLEGGRINPFTT